jgi:hypothetical protein
MFYKCQPSLGSDWVISGLRHSGACRTNNRQDRIKPDKSAHFQGKDLFIRCNEFFIDYPLGSSTRYNHDRAGCVDLRGIGSLFDL